MRFPEWWKAPGEILDIDGHCGLVAAWAVLHYFGIQVSANEIVRSCRHTRPDGVFCVDLAFALKKNGLQVVFYTDPDNEIGEFEQAGYNRARRLGILPQPALNLAGVLRERRRGRIPIVIFDQDGPDSGHFSPLLGCRNGLLRLPYADNRSMPTDEFLTAWSGAGILRQCVIAWPH